MKQVNTERKKKLEDIKTEECKRKRRQWKQRHCRIEQDARKKWGKKQRIQHTYGGKQDSVDPVAEPEVTASAEVTPTRSSKGKAARGQCKCGSRSHLRTSHKDCPLNSRSRTTKVLFSAPQLEESSGSEESDKGDVESSDSECMFPVLHEEKLATSSPDDDVVQFMIPLFCDCNRAAHKHDCQFNPRNKHRVPPKLPLSHSQQTVTASAGHVHDDVSITGFDPPPPVDFSLSSPSVEEAIKFI